MATPKPAPDTLRRRTAAGEQLRLVTVLCPIAVAEACARSELTGIDAIALGRALISGYLLIAAAKRDDERLRIQVAGEGQVGQVLVDVQADGRGRAALQRGLEAGHPLHILLDESPRPVLGPVVGNVGSLTVTRDLGMRQQYQGHVGLVSGEIDEDLENYLAESEQIPSILRAALSLDEAGRVVHAAGILVQALPDADGELLLACRRRLKAGALHSALPTATTHDELAALALGRAESKPSVGLNAELALRFECRCGPEQARRVLSSLGADDLLALADEQPVTEIRCNFCGRTSMVDAQGVREVAASILRQTN